MAAPLGYRRLCSGLIEEQTLPELPFVWLLTFDLSGMDDPARNNVPASTVLGVIRARKLFHHGKVVAH